MVADETGRSSLRRLQALLLVSTDITDFLESFSAALAADISRGGVSVWCSVTLLRAGKPTTVACSDPTAAALDHELARLPDSPCISAARSHRTVHVADLHTDSRWERYAVAASGFGVHAVLAVPFQLPAGAGAAVNIYADRPGIFRRSLIELAHREVARTSDALGLAVRMAGYQETGEDLSAALASRTTIDLAVGIVMGQNRCTQAEAVEILKTAANHRNLKLRELAQALVHSVGDGPVTTHFGS